MTIHLLTGQHLGFHGKEVFVCLPENEHDNQHEPEERAGLVHCPLQYSKLSLQGMEDNYHLHNPQHTECTNHQELGITVGKYFPQTEKYKQSHFKTLLCQISATIYTFSHIRLAIHLIRPR